MSHAFRVLRVVFEKRENLDREFAANLVNGGLFLPGQLDLLYGEPVLVFMDLAFVGTTVEVEGRVVQTIPVEFEAGGGRSGVALELSEGAPEIRLRLEEAIGERLEAEHEAKNDGSRISKRTVAHVQARIRVPGMCELEGRTRNLSLAGVLVAISGDLPTVGQHVSVAIVHPMSGEEHTLKGVVARHAMNEDGQPCAIGIQFLVSPEESETTTRYLNHVKASEHARRIGGITGSIDTLGLNDLLMSFGQCVPKGRFTLTRAGEMGTICVEAGVVTSAQKGFAVGVKALVRMSAWKSGHFEFHANWGADEKTEMMALPVEAALIEAARLIDENLRSPASHLSGHTEVSNSKDEIDLDDPDLSKAERQILDLAGEGTTVSRLFDVIQEPDGRIERSILDLAERGVLRIENPE